jgi:putative tRNA adenosine deaminase-associated protein
VVGDDVTVRLCGSPTPAPSHPNHSGPALPAAAVICHSRLDPLGVDGGGGDVPAGPDAVPEAYAVVVYREDGAWQAALLPQALTEDLDGLVAAVRQQSGDGGSFALVDVAHEFFVVVRVSMGRVRLLLSDVTAAVAWDLAGQVVDRLDLEVPGDDDLEEVWPAGDLGVFDDLGLDEMELGAVLADLDAYADEMLAVIARRLGFAEVYERVVDAVVD